MYGGRRGLFGLAACFLDSPSKNCGSTSNKKHKSFTQPDSTHLWNTTNFHRCMPVNPETFREQDWLVFSYHHMNNTSDELLSGTKHPGMKLITNWTSVNLVGLADLKLWPWDISTFRPFCLPFVCLDLDIEMTDVRSIQRFTQQVCWFSGRDSSVAASQINQSINLIILKLRLVLFYTGPINTWIYAFCQTLFYPWCPERLQRWHSNLDVHIPHV